MDIDLSEFDVPGSCDGTPCIVVQALSDLDEDRRIKLAEALTREVAHPTPKHKWAVSSERVARTLKTWGYPMGACAVGRHRRGVCSCPT